MVGRPKSLAAVEECVASERPLFLCAQRSPDVDEPGHDDLYVVGVAANILQTLRMPDGTMKVVVEGLGRGRILRVYEDDSFTSVEVEPVADRLPAEKEGQALMRAVVNQFDDYARMSQRVAPEIVISLRATTEPDTLSDMICAYLVTPVAERQELLDTTDAKERLEKLSAILMRENELLGIEQKVRERVREQMERGQREHFLHEQLKVIRQELGSREEGLDEASELRELIEKVKMHLSSKREG